MPRIRMGRADELWSWTVLLLFLACALGLAVWAVVPEEIVASGVAERYVYASVAGR